MKFKQIILWTTALVIGAVIGTLSVNNGWTGVDRFMDFLASAYTSCFKFVAIPTVALAVITALAGLGKEGSGRQHNRLRFENCTRSRTDANNS